MYKRTPFKVGLAIVVVLLTGVILYYCKMGFACSSSTTYYAPIANLTADHVNIAPGTTVTFDGSSSYDPDGGAIVTYKLFEEIDGVNQPPFYNGPNPTCEQTYTTGYRHIVGLEVKDNEGTWSSSPSYWTIYINLEAPIAVLDADPFVAPNVDANFDGSLSYDPDNYPKGGIVKYHFTFGDGTETETESSTTTHAYPASPIPHNYTATLKVKDDDGTWSELSSFTIRVGNLINAQFRAISGGSIHSLFLDKTGMVWACGSGEALGTGYVKSHLKPVPVHEGANIYPIDDDNYLEGIKFIDAGAGHSLAVDGSSVWAWGFNSRGQIGVGTPVGWDVIYSEPVQVKTPLARSGNLSGIVKVAASKGPIDNSSYSLALGEYPNTAWAWGSNFYNVDDGTPKENCSTCEHRYGQLGIGVMTGPSPCQPCSKPNTCGADPITNPVRILEDIVDIDAGCNHSIACDVNSNVYTWGYNGDGELGNGTYAYCGEGSYSLSPVQVPGLQNIIDVAAGSGSKTDFDGGTSYALENLAHGGHVWAWGNGENGRLGDGIDEAHHRSTTPIQVENLQNIVAISAGYAHALALEKLDQGGYVWAWGSDCEGQLGNGSEAGSSSIPVKVQKAATFGGGDLTNIVAIDAGVNHSMAIDTNGDVWVWGAYPGQLGTGRTGDHTSAFKLTIQIVP